MTTSTETTTKTTPQKKQQPTTTEPPTWHVYVVACADASLYVGIAADLQRRVAAHNAGRGARYTRARRPVTCVWRWPCESAEEARRLEGMMKGLTRAQRLRLVDGDVDVIAPLLDRVAARMAKGTVTDRARRTRGPAAP